MWANGIVVADSGGEIIAPYLTEPRIMNTSLPIFRPFVSTGKNRKVICVGPILVDGYTTLVDIEFESTGITFARLLAHQKNSDGTVDTATDAISDQAFYTKWMLRNQIAVPIEQFSWGRIVAGKEPWASGYSIMFLYESGSSRDVSETKRRSE